MSNITAYICTVCTYKKSLKGSILINHLPLLTSHNFTVPSSEDVITNFELN